VLLLLLPQGLGGRQLQLPERLRLTQRAPPRKDFALAKLSSKLRLHLHGAKSYCSGCQQQKLLQLSCA
jgi:hypothetical protein